MIYVTSDLHGYPFEKFKKLLDKVNFGNDDFLYVLGDVIDRGNDGIKILKWLMTMPNTQLIIGNHEAMLLACDFLFEEITETSISNLTGEKLSDYLTWISNGGQTTINALVSISKEEINYILEFLRDSPLFDAVSVNGRDFLLTHAGLGNFNPDKKLIDYTVNELLWTRPNITDKYFSDKITVFGHTPTVCFGSEYKGKAIVTSTWIDIDTGVSAGFKPMLLRLEDLSQIYL